MIKPHRNFALPRLMKLVLDKGYRLECIIKVRVFISGLNLEVLKEVPVEETSGCAPRVSRISATSANLSSYGEVSRFAGPLM